MMKCYLSLLIALVTSYASASDQPLKEENRATIGYKSVSEALTALRSNHEMTERSQQGWLLFTDKGRRVFWSFPPKGHPAYPAAVKRELVEKDGTLYMAMAVHCESDKEACDQLVRDFQDLNKKMSEAIQAHQSSKP